MRSNPSPIRVQKYVPLVQSVINTLNVPSYIEWEDFMQQGMLGLCEATYHYKAAKGDFEPYAVVVVRNNLIAYLDRIGKMHRVDTRPFEDVQDVTADTVDSINYIVDRLAVLKIALKDMTTKQRLYVISRYGLATGVPLSATDIALEYDVSVSAVNMTLKTALKEIEKSFEQNLAFSV